MRPSSEKASPTTCVHYDVDLALMKGKQYFGRVNISFELTKMQSIFLDYHGDQFQNLVINGHQVDQNYEGERVYLDKKYLKMGKNLVKINIQN